MLQYFVSSYWWIILHCTDVPHFVCPVDGGFYLVAIRNNAAVSIYVEILCGRMFSILLGIYLGTELLDHKLILFLTILGTAGLFKVAVPFYFPTSCVWEIQFFRILANTLSVFSIIAFLCVCMLSCFSHVWFFATPWTVACQALLSLGFSRQEYWSGLPCPPPGGLLTQGSNSCLLWLLNCHPSGYQMMSYYCGFWFALPWWLMI